MPTGYTAGVADGTTKTFTDYAYTCARAFGALVTERDNPITPDIPVLKVSQYYFDNITKRKSELKKLTSMSDTKAESEFIREKNKDIKYYTKAIKEIKKTSIRYQSMIEKCKKFVSPSQEHDSYKEFLISQLQSSLDFDCSTTYYVEKLNSVKKLRSWRKWLKDKIKQTKQELLIYEQSLKEEICQVDSRNQWLDQLMTAIKEVEK